MIETLDVSRVRELNDALRRSLVGGLVVMTPGVIYLGSERQERVLQAIAAFDQFDSDNDPYGEHDFGAFEFEGERILFKIDYYDPGCALTGSGRSQGHKPGAHRHARQ